MDNGIENSLFNKQAMDNGIRSIAFPSISTGIYSFPVELAAKIAVHTVNRFLQDNPDCFDLVEENLNLVMLDDAIPAGEDMKSCPK